MNSCLRMSRCRLGHAYENTNEPQPIQKSTRFLSLEDLDSKKNMVIKCDTILKCKNCGKMILIESK